jgi:hypothetical protein
MQAKKIVAGVDLGPAADNHSMGVLLATKNNSSWSISSFEPIENYDDPNAPYIDILKSCSLIVIDAPLWFESEDRCRSWENHLIELANDDRAEFHNWKPSQTHALYSHAWRTKDLLRGLHDANASIYEIFPAAWFALIYRHDQPTNWKGNKIAVDEKRIWGTEFHQFLQKRGIVIDTIDTAKLKADELDALPCIFGAILLIEGIDQLICRAGYHEAETEIVFPARILWNDAIQNSWTGEEFEEFLLAIEGGAE